MRKITARPVFMLIVVVLAPLWWSCADNTPVPARLNTTAAASATSAPAPVPVGTFSPATAPVSPSPSSTSVVPQAPSPTTAVAPAPATVAPTSEPPLLSEGGYVYYYKEEGLYSTRPDVADSPRRLAGNVIGYARAGEDRVVVLQATPEGVLQLKLLRLSGGITATQAVLDSRVFVALPAAQRNGRSGAGLYGVERRAIGNMALSPDGTQVAYTKANLAGATFEGLSGAERPTELWLATLDPATPALRRLVANDKDYIYQPVWSTDGNRIAFMRLSTFGTGAGFPTALWSVYRDGSRLVFLTGPDLGSAGGEAYQANPAFNLVWTGPLTLSFRGGSGNSPALWLHDLNAGRDFPRPLALEASFDSAFCPVARRYFYIRQTGTAGSQRAGLLAVEVDNPAPGGANALPPSSVLDAGATQVYGCVEDTLLYRDGQGQVSLQRFKADGTPAAPKIIFGLAVEPRLEVMAALSPDRQQVAVLSQADGTNSEKLKLSVFRANGIVVAAGGLTTTPLSLAWANPQAVAVTGTGFGQGQNQQLFTFYPEGKLVKQADSSKDGIRLVTR